MARAATSTISHRRGWSLRDCWFLQHDRRAFWCTCPDRLTSLRLTLSGVASTGLAPLRIAPNQIVVFEACSITRVISIVHDWHCSAFSYRCFFRGRTSQIASSCRQFEHGMPVRVTSQRTLRWLQPRQATRERERRGAPWPSALPETELLSGGTPSTAAVDIRRQKRKRN